MKHLILSLLGTFLIFGAIAQNGGQYPENNSVKLEWVNTSVLVTNKQSCESVIKVSYAQSEVNLTIPGNSNLLFMPPAAIATIKAKSLTNCGNTDFGWVELTLSAMPAKFLSLDVLPMGNKEALISFKVAEVSNAKQYKILISTDGVEYHAIDSIPAENGMLERTYSIKVNTLKIKK